MKHSRSLILVPLLALIFIIFYTSCQTELNNSSNIPQSQQRVSRRLSDNPVNFDAVNVDIQSVEVQVIPDSCQGRHHDDDDNDGDDDRDHDHDARCSVWDTLDIRPGVYNLLDLANGTDTILANGFTVAGKISKIRLTIGDENSVVIDSISYPLTLWNDSHHVTIKVKGEDVDAINPNDLQFWLDFDAGRSIVKIRDNNFVLKPFLRVWLPAHTASISGHVLPDSAASVV